MKSKYLIFTILCFLPQFSNAQYTWIEVILPDTIDVKMIAFDTAGIHYVASNKGVYSSEDSYQWEQTGLSDYVSYIHIGDNNTFYAGMDVLYRSNDNGITWDSVFYCSQGGIMSIYTIGDSIICLGTWGGIFRSADSGQTWDRVLFAYNSEVFKAIVANSEGVLFAGSTNFSGNYSPGGVYQSDDIGETWELIGLDYYFISAMAIDSEDRIYACARGNYYTGKLAVFKSTDHGVSWEIVYENNPVNTITTNEYDEIAIGCDTQDGSQGGIFCSYDEAATWEEITNNLPFNDIYQVLFNPENYLYTITHNDTRLYKTETAVWISDKHSDVKTGNVTLFPNPAQNEISIRCNKTYINEIIVTNFSGLEIFSTTNINDELIKVNVKNMKSGIYFIHFKNNNKSYSICKFIKY